MPPPTRRLRLPVPCNVVTGALAAGKTTLVASLLQNKPDDELWAVLVNEFGAAGLDAALLEGEVTAEGRLEGQHKGGTNSGSKDSSDGVHIQQLAGGCLCCVLSNVTPLAIAQLLRRVKPDRLIIEPSGLAHPATLLDMLQGGHLGSSLALQPVVCLVDVTQFAGGCTSPVTLSRQLLADQISVADVMVGSKADLCDNQTLEAFNSWAQQLSPPKRLVSTAQHGRLNAATTAAVIGSAAPGRRSGRGFGQPGSLPGSAPTTAQQQQETVQQETAQQEQLKPHVPVQRPRRGPSGSPWLSSSAADTGPAAADARTGERSSRPVFQRLVMKSGGGGAVACGWVFNRDCRFERTRLLELLQLLGPNCLRVKGVFRIAAAQWEALSAPATQAAVAAAAVDGTEGTVAASAAPIELKETAYRKDSRIELIIDVSAHSGTSAAAACSETAGQVDPQVSGSSSGTLEQQAARLSLEEEAPCSKRDTGSNSGSGSNIGGASIRDNSSGSNMGSISVQQQVDGALAAAKAGDWSALEALLKRTLQTADGT